MEQIGEMVGRIDKRSNLVIEMAQKSRNPVARAIYVLCN